MISYIRFFISLFYYKGTYFKYPKIRQAIILKRFCLYFEAGKKYLSIQLYEEAAQCFLHANAHRHLMYTYVKLGLHSKALEIAENKHYYKQGAKICMSIGNVKKAASFYHHFNPLHAAKLYKKEGYFYEAAKSYLAHYDFELALGCFRLCRDEKQRKTGIRQIEEIAITLYFVKAYKEAYALFMALGDYPSAKLCEEALPYSLINPSPLHILE
jgi:hypothetical protein